jgi:hypothetical protein
LSESLTAERSTATYELRPVGYCYRQQYLAKNPNGYCGFGGTGVSCPVGFAEAVDEAAKSTSAEIQRYGESSPGRPGPDK